MASETPEGSAADNLLRGIRDLHPAPELRSEWATREIARALRAHVSVDRPRLGDAPELLSAIKDLTDEHRVDVGDAWMRNAIAEALRNHRAVTPAPTTTTRSAPTPTPTPAAGSASRRRESPVAWVRFERTLPAAAAGPEGGARQVVSSEDGTITLICEEAPNSGVLVRVEAAERRDDLVELPWRLVGGADSTATWLVTPLAPVRGRWSALYALNGVARADDVEIGPPHWAPIARLDEVDVRTALTDGAHGSARRAWRLLVEEAELTGVLRVVIEELLEDHDA